MNNLKLLNILRLIAIIEGFTYLSFFITVPLKKFYLISQPNYINGMLHGVFFIFYVLLVIWLYKEKNFSIKILFQLIIASLIPFGTFVADSKLIKPAILNIRK